MFFNIGLIIIFTAIIGLLLRKFKQPLMLAYIMTGIVLGPTGIGIIEILQRHFGINLINIGVINVGIINNYDIIDTLSVFGILFLLFMAGIELNIKELKGIGIRIISISVGQMLLCFLSGLALTKIMGFDLKTSLYISTALAFSSTIIVVKILSEKKDLSALYGKISVGILLFQDFTAIFILVLLSNLNTAQNIPFMINFGFVILKILFIGLLTYTTSQYFLPRIFKSIAKSPEMLFLGGIAHCFLFALIAESLHISMQIGAFLAGISLATLPYHYQIAGKIKPLRDFFLILFFVTLGLQFNFFETIQFLPLAIILILFIIIAKPFIIQLLSAGAGFRKRTSFLSGITLAQISMFSILILDSGIKAGDISSYVLSIIIFVNIVAIIFSTGASEQSDKLYDFLEKYLFERQKHIEPTHLFNKKLKNHIILVGYHRIGIDILKKIKTFTRNYVVVDNNPQVITALIDKRTPCIFGDIENTEVLEKINIAEAKMIISTIPDFNDNLTFIHNIRKENKNTPIIIASVDDIDHALSLYDSSADFVILPYFLSGDFTASLVETLNKHKNIERLRQKHIEELKEKINLGVSHPKKAIG